ncbi:MAG TPA: helix-turn-helix domain-containing protein [Phycisphaerae bacterium]|nr:helix-turn-helix domain-containing protein [Phycisphaerae bacterium]
MAKMFYTAEEAAQKLGISPDQLKDMVSQNKLREFRDGARVMFKVDQVDKIASDKGKSSAGTAVGIGLSDSGIALAGDSHASDVISLADTGTQVPSAKDDTVVTGLADTGTQPGKQVFESGEIKSADTGAQTRIQSAVDDQLSLEGVGSGSGLLDLTRESDDTSLGAELLDEIYPGAGDSKPGDSGIASASGIFEQSTTSSESSGPSGLEHMAGTTTSSAPATEFVEAVDPAAGAFGGLAFASVFILLATAIIAICLFAGFSPGWVEWITSSMSSLAIFAVALIVLSFIFAGIGFFTGKTAAE